MINTRRIKWVYEHFGAMAALKCLGYSLIATLAICGYCLTLPFQFFWLLHKRIRDGKL